MRKLKMHTKTGVCVCFFCFFFPFHAFFSPFNPGVQITHNATQTQSSVDSSDIFLKDLHNTSTVERFDD